MASKGRTWRTVVSPPVPEKPKAEKPSAPAPEVKGWRSRPTRPGFSGVVERPFYGTEDEVRERAAVDEMAGAAPVVEQLRGAIYSTPPREVPTVLDLAKRGLAHEHPGAGGTRWSITPEGQQILTDAMLGRPHA